MAALAGAQRAHIDAVMQVAGVGVHAPQAQAHDALIRASWQRCCTSTGWTRRACRRR